MSSRPHPASRQPARSQQVVDVMDDREIEEGELPDEAVYHLPPPPLSASARSAKAASARASAIMMGTLPPPSAHYVRSAYGDADPPRSRKTYEMPPARHSQTYEAPPLHPGPRYNEQDLVHESASYQRPLPKPRSLPARAPPHQQARHYPYYYGGGGMYAAYAHPPQAVPPPRPYYYNDKNPYAHCYLPGPPHAPWYLDREYAGPPLAPRSQPPY